MKTLIASVVTFFVVFSGGAAHAKTSRYTGIGITGYTEWPRELNAAVLIMRGSGVPIHNSCLTGDLCVNLGHYRASDGAAGYAVMDGNRNSHVRFNNMYDNRERPYRISLILHELGHEAGLHHSSSCDTAMHPAVPACGKYILGYNASDRAQLKRVWG